MAIVGPYLGVHFSGEVRTWNSAVQMSVVRFGINLLRLGQVRWRYSTPLNADPLDGGASRP